jgi:membrane protein implicated in regulation of membrane protease activity
MRGEDTVDRLFYLWLCLGCVLIITDLMVGSVWLLLLGGSALVVSGFVFAGITETVTNQCFLFCVLALVFCVANAFRTMKKTDAHQSDPLDNPDVGQEVVVKGYTPDKVSARVFYRGITWEARADSGFTLSDGVWVISGREANVLLLRPRK